MKKVLILAAVVFALAAAPALASNTGFKLNYPLNAGLNLISFPFFYYPNGDVADTTQTSKDACNDLLTNDCGALADMALIELRPTGPFRFACTLPDPAAFNLTVGVAYFAEARNTCTADIVGSHDDTYSVGGTSSVDLNAGLSPVSVPYHVVAENAKELCDAINLEAGTTTTDGLAALIELRATGPFRFGCSLPAAAAFPVDPGEGYFAEVAPAAATPFQVRYDTY